MDNYNKYAVLIGNQKSPADHSNKLPDLKCPKSDVQGLKAELIRPDRGHFQEKNIVGLTDPSDTTKLSIEKAIATCFSNARSRSSDLILIYYSGHGILKGNDNLYLAASDTLYDELDATAISISVIDNLLNDTPRYKKVVLIFDCCHSGFAANNLPNSKGDVGNKNLKKITRDGLYILSSTDTNEAFEGEEYSLFTKHLIQGLNTGDADLNKDGYISIEELFTYVCQKVKNEDDRQEPVKYSYRDTGNLHIAKSGNPIKETENISKDSLSDYVPNKKLEILKVIQEQASYRPIVPFLGAGISVSAGFPTTKFIIQYLAKVKFAIQYGVFEDRFPILNKEDKSKLDMYRRHPSKYLEDFG